MLAAAFALLAPAAPARAEVVMLVCDTNDGHKVIFDIDLTAHTARTYLAGGSGGAFTPAQITDRTIIVNPGIRIDRLLGIADFGAGTTATCQRAGKPVL
ncbi:MAG: hypothetical protein KGL11_02445 [Alphaproteobacteria bacterium]|nr:hypothetical protein [Alphaproteobacteria bacterium]